MKPISLTDKCIKRTEKFWKDEKETLPLQEAVDTVANELIEHFKTDKYALRASYYATELAELFIGIEPIQLLANAISEYAELTLDEKNTLVFVHKKLKKSKSK